MDDNFILHYLKKSINVLGSLHLFQEEKNRISHPILLMEGKTKKTKKGSVHSKSVK